MCPSAASSSAIHAIRQTRRASTLTISGVAEATSTTLHCRYGSTACSSARVVPSSKQTSSNAATHCDFTIALLIAVIALHSQVHTGPRQVDNSKVKRSRPHESSTLLVETLRIVETNHLSPPPNPRDRPLTPVEYPRKSIDPPRTAPGGRFSACLARPRAHAPKRRTADATAPIRSPVRGSLPAVRLLPRRLVHLRPFVNVRRTAYSSRPRSAIWS